VGRPCPLIWGGIERSTWPLALEEVRDAGSPAGLVGGAEAAAGFGVEVFVEEKRVSGAAAVARTPSVGAGEEKRDSGFLLGEMFVRQSFVASAFGWCRLKRCMNLWLTAAEFV